MALAGKVCLVTGASRGLGKGIAMQLGENGATVYITGRTLDSSSASAALGSLTDTTQLVNQHGGQCIPVQCDHSNDQEVENLFDQIQREQDGQLDIIVNNAYSAVDTHMEIDGKKFWEQSLSTWDSFNNVGLRNHYRCTVLAARMMVPRRQGLVVNVSSAGGLFYMFNPSFGIGKEGVDRMAVDCGIELRKHNVACLSLWTGGVKTEKVVQIINTRKEQVHVGQTLKPEEKIIINYMLDHGESTEYIGKCVVALAKDPDIMKKTSKVHISMDLGNEYGFVDIDCRKPLHIRQVNTILSFSPRWRWLSNWIPDFVKIPCWALHLSANKFS